RKRKAAAFGDLETSRERARLVFEQTLERTRALQDMLGVGFDQRMRGAERDAVADASEYILQPSAADHVVQHFAGRDERQIVTRRAFAQQGFLPRFARALVTRQHRIQRITESRMELTGERVVPAMPPSDRTAIATPECDKPSDV